jgi:hypothetical protein
VISNILIGLSTALFITLVLLIGSIFFDEKDWKGKK